MIGRRGNGMEKDKKKKDEWSRAKKRGIKITEEMLKEV